MQHAVLEQDIRHDPASKLIIALLATQTGLGIQEINAVRTLTEEIRRERN